MTPATARSSTEPSAPALASAHSVPTLEQLYQMTSVPDERVVIPGVDWAFYEQLVDSIPDWANIHIDYDGKDVEIMTTSLLHDYQRKLLRQLVPKQA